MVDKEDNQKNKKLPQHFSLERVIRPNILNLKPYRCARDDYDTGILLDANENSMGSALVISHPILDLNQKKVVQENFKIETNHILNTTLNYLHRYPSPSQIPIKQNLCDYKNSFFTNLPNLEISNVFLGVGSDEILDLLFRITCKPGVSEGIGDQVIITPPTYGMYSTCAMMNDVGIIHVPLNVKDGMFTVDLNQLDNQLSRQTDSRPIKMIILCSPGNPTGTTIPIETIKEIISNPKFKGILVVDEAYIDFAGNEKSAIQLVRQGWKNLIVTQTMSKAFGLAGIRLGIAYGPADLIQVLNNTKAPYSISSPTSTLGYQATKMEAIKRAEKTIQTIIENREWLKDHLSKINGLGKILGSNEANFILVQVLKSSPSQQDQNENSNSYIIYSPDNERAKKVYKFMAEDFNLIPNTPIVVRYRGDEFGCTGCLRITVGTRLESQNLVEKLTQTLKIIN